MEIGIVFLISCVIAARFLEKRRMRAAAVLYSILFTIVLCLLVFALNIPITRMALSNILGAELYRELHLLALDAMNMSFYGVSMITIIGLTLAVQLALIILGTTRRVVRCFIGKSPARKFKKVYFRFAQIVRNLHLPKRINLLYCRMLN